MDLETNRMAVNQEMAGKWRRRKWIKLVILLLIVLIIGGYCLWGQKLWLAMTAKGYQAVFLTNGQVYFGKLTASGTWLKLTDIYYLSASEDLQQTGSTTPAANQSPDLQLVKLGGELHGPTDMMYIEKDKLMFWENLKDDSKVVDAIKNYKNK